MESKFGVALKSTGGGEGSSNNNEPKRTPSGGYRTHLKQANVKDLKAMFDVGKGSDEETSKNGNNGTQESSSAPVSSSLTKPGVKTSRTKLDTAKTWTELSRCRGTGKDQESLPVSIAAKGDIKVHSSEKPKEKDEVRSDTDFQPQVATVKVFEHKSYKANILESKVTTASSSTAPVEKSVVKSQLLAGLALLRTRPGSGGKKEEKSVVSSQTETSVTGMSTKVDRVAGLSKQHKTHSFETRTTNLKSESIVGSGNTKLLKEKANNGSDLEIHLNTNSLEKFAKLGQIDLDDLKSDSSSQSESSFSPRIFSPKGQSPKLTRFPRKTSVEKNDDLKLDLSDLRSESPKHFIRRYSSDSSESISPRSSGRFGSGNLRSEQFTAGSPRSNSLTGRESPRTVGQVGNGSPRSTSGSPRSHDLSDVNSIGSYSGRSDSPKLDVSGRGSPKFSDLTGNKSPRQFISSSSKYVSHSDNKDLESTSVKNSSDENNTGNVSSWRKDRQEVVKISQDGSALPGWKRTVTTTTEITRTCNLSNHPSQTNDNTRKGQFVSAMRSKVGSVDSGKPVRSDLKVSVSRSVSEDKKASMSVVSKEPSSSGSEGSFEFKQKKYMSRKMNPETFSKIKSGFESKESVTIDRTSARPISIERKVNSSGAKPGVAIHTTKQLAERKKSLEQKTGLHRQWSWEKSDSKAFANRGVGMKVSEIVQSINTSNVKEKEKLRTSTSSQHSAGTDDDEGLYEEVGNTVFNQQYQDVDVILRDDDSTSSSETEAIYEFIPDVLNKHDNKEGQIDNGIKTNRPATRRHGQRRKNTKSPGVLANKKHSQNSLNRRSLERRSSGGDTNNKQKKTDLSEDGGNEADEDWETDSSNSGIYEPIEGGDWIRPTSSSDLEIDEPVQSSKREKKKKAKKSKNPEKEGQTLTAKLKKLYKSTLSSGQTESEPASKSSSSAMSKIGEKLKLKKNKSSEVDLTAMSGECDSQDGGYRGESDAASRDGETTDFSSSSADQMPQTGGKAENGSGQPPPLPPRLSVSIPRTAVPEEGSHSPPLPPRNRNSQNVNLTTVIPIVPGGLTATQSTGDLRKGNWPPSKDSYLHGQHLTSPHSTSDLIGAAFDSPDNSSPPPALPPKRKTDSYVYPDPPTRSPEATQQRSTYLDRKVSDASVASSAYIKHEDVETEPAPAFPPFEHLIKYRSQLDDDIYVEMTDDQVYGTLSNRYQPKLESEPLYQYYDRDRVNRASRAIRRSVATSGSDHSDTEGGIYQDLSKGFSEEIFDLVDKKSSIKQDEPSPKKPSTLELIGQGGTLNRKLWSEMPEVKESGILESVSPHEKKIQEAMFEIIMSEASYLKSLNILIDIFLMSPEFSSGMSDRCVLTQQERHVLFSNIGTVREASENILAELETRWQKSVLLTDVCDIIYAHSCHKFNCYIIYTSNQTYQTRQLEELRKRQEFMETLKRLQTSPECQNLPMDSFLLLPMQRITRLPLLVDAICHRLEPGTDRHKSATRAQKALSKVVRRCNEGARKMQQTEQICLIAQQMDFKLVKEIPLVSASRSLVKEGELTRIITEASSRLPFGKAKPAKQSIYVFIFTDLVLLTKKKGSQYLVQDYAQRNLVQMEKIDSGERSRHIPLGVPSGCKNLILMVFLQNHTGSTTEMVLSCNKESDRTRWIDAVSTSTKNDDDERIYEEWDCPQVQCVTQYVPKEPDELGLEESDVVNVFKKMADGWYEGERIRDGESGWFPANCTEEIMNSHVRAKNLRQRYRLLQASQEIIS